MKKLKVFSVKNLSVLTREEMATVRGGDFTVYDCNVRNVGQYCAISFSPGPTVHLGICNEYVTTTATGFKYSYKCEPIPDAK